MPHRFNSIYLAIVIVLAVLTSCVSTSGSLFQSVVEADSGRAAEEEDSTAADEKDAEGQDDGAEESEDAEESGETAEIGVRIVTVPEGASISIKGDFIGLTPLLFAPDADNFRIIIEKDG